MNIQELMNKYYNNLNDNDKLICKYIINNKDTCYKLSIENLLQNVNVSSTTLFRFAQKISLTGFSELKVKLRLEAESKSNNKINLLESCYR